MPDACDTRVRDAESDEQRVVDAAVEHRHHPIGHDEDPLDRAWSAGLVRWGLRA